MSTIPKIFTICCLLYGSTSLVNCTCEQTDLTVIVSHTVTLGSDNFNLVKSFVSRLVDELAISVTGVHVGGTLYSTQIDYGSTFNLYQGQTSSDVQQQFASWSYNPAGANDLNSALLQAHGNWAGFRRYDVGGTFLVITDTNSSVGGSLLSTTARDLRLAGARILTIAVANMNGAPSQGTKQMLSGVSGSSQYALSADSISNLASLVPAVVSNLLCTIPTTPLPTTTLPTGSTTPQPGAGCCDVLTIIASNSNGGNTNFINVRDFYANQLINALSPAKGGIRMGAYEFSDANVVKSYGLDQYPTAAEQSTVVKSWSYEAGLCGPKTAFEQVFYALYGRDTSSQRRPSVVVYFANELTNVGLNPTSTAKEIRTTFGSKIIVVAYSGVHPLTTADQNEFLQLTGTSSNIITVSSTSQLSSYLSLILAKTGCSAACASTTTGMPQTTTTSTAAPQTTKATITSTATTQGATTLPTTTTTPTTATTTTTSTTTRLTTTLRPANGSDVVVMVDTAFTVTYVQRQTWEALKLNFVNAINYGNVRIAIGYSSGNGSSGFRSSHVVSGLSVGGSQSAIDAFITDTVVKQRYNNEWVGIPDMYSALTVAKAHLKEYGRPAARKYILLVSDGIYSPRYGKSPYALALSLRESQTIIFASSIGNADFVSLGNVTGSPANVSPGLQDMKQFVSRINNAQGVAL